MTTSTDWLRDLMGEPPEDGQFDQWDPPTTHRWLPTWPLRSVRSPDRCSPRGVARLESWLHGGSISRSSATDGGPLSSWPELWRRSPPFRPDDHHIHPAPAPRGQPGRRSGRFPGSSSRRPPARWRSDAARLALGGHRVGAGRGSTPWPTTCGGTAIPPGLPTGTNSLDRLGDDIAGIVDALPRPAALVGASIGGASALLAVAERDIDVTALVLVDVATRFLPSGADQINGFHDGPPGWLCIVGRGIRG